MKITEIKNELLGDSAFCVDHPCGLKIIVMPKPGYSSTYAVFGTKFGSVDTFLKNGDGFEQIPEGTAHFLEHKLFESEDLAAFERFSKTGASANAYTSFERTAYLFSCSENFEESLEILLDFVQEPYFTPENVEKEQGIIGQEIRMYKDDADWEVMFNLLLALYSEHPVRKDIAGTQESISEITPDLLYKIYHSFYNLGNMVLCVSGNVDIDTVLRVADKCLKKTEGGLMERKFTPESPEPLTHYTEEKLSVATTQFLLGFKEDIDKPELTLAEELAGEIGVEALCSKSSELYNRLLSEGLISMDFYSECFSGFGFSCVMAGGTSSDPKRTAELITEAFEEAAKNGIDHAAFERTKRKLYGRLVMSYNSIDGIANQLMNLHFSGQEPFSELETCRGITEEMVNERLKAIRREYSALSVISPID